jgi:hypothetical protein
MFKNVYKHHNKAPYVQPQHAKGMSTLHIATAAEQQQQ